MNVTIWPIWQSGVDDTEYADTGKEWPLNVGFQMYAKQLTDTELAAEVWHAKCSRNVRIYDKTQDIPGVSWEWEETVMERFATLPHAASSSYE